VGRLKPFFSFYGSKFLLAPHYAQPFHDSIIECFAGSAGYATMHNSKQVLLVDLDPVICAIWEYLIKVNESEILRLPLHFESVDDLSIHQEARWLIGFWINKACSSPCKRPSKWARQQYATGRPLGFWSDSIRYRLSVQIQYIRHWRVLNSSYADIPEQPATYFVDPPYREMGKHYKFNNIDFRHLGDWCKNRAATGSQVIACEAQGADWLPFVGLRDQGKVNNIQRSGPNLRRYAEQVCYLPGV
jgi:hypothetical protein